MSRRSIISLAASVIIGIGCIAMISTDAFAYKEAVALVFIAVVPIMAAFIVVLPIVVLPIAVAFTVVRP